MKEVFKKDGDTLELYEDMTQYILIGWEKQFG